MHPGDILDRDSFYNKPILVQVHASLVLYVQWLEDEVWGKTSDLEPPDNQSITDSTEN